jgi:hypothetical protein
VVETVGESPDELDAVVEEGAWRRVLDLESCDRHRKEIDKPPDQTVLIYQRVDWIHLEPPAAADVLTKNLRPALTCVKCYTHGYSGRRLFGQTAIRQDGYTGRRLFGFTAHAVDHTGARPDRFAVKP